MLMQASSGIRKHDSEGQTLPNVIQIYRMREISMIL